LRKLKIEKLEFERNCFLDKNARTATGKTQKEITKEVEDAEAALGTKASLITDLPKFSENYINPLK